MDENIAARIRRAKYLLNNARHAAMATVNEDGSPHNSPFFFIHDNKLEYIYWGSHPDSLHCQNARRTGQVFIVLYESTVGGGLYIKADGAKQLDGSELETALEIHNGLRAKYDNEPIPLSYYSGNSEQKMFSAKPANFYVNSALRDADGMIIRDNRHEITLQDLAF